jgi:hypothetical protein
VVGVGALVGRPPAEAADIVRMLYAAGLHRLHGFGVKGRVLDPAAGWWRASTRPHGQRRPVGAAGCARTA